MWLMGSCKRLKPNKTRPSRIFQKTPVFLNLFSDRDDGVPIFVCSVHVRFDLQFNKAFADDDIIDLFDDSRSIYTGTYLH